MNLDGFETLEDARNAVVEVDTKQVGSGQARGLFIEEETDPDGTYAGQKIWTFFKSVLENKSHPLFALADAIIITASDGASYFGMDESKADGVGNRKALAGLVALKVMTQETADKFTSKVISKTYPYKDISLIQFNQAKGIYSEREVENYNGQDIKITFNSEYDCPATTWVKSDFADENFGKVGYIKKGVNLTKISTSGKKASGKLYVRVPLESADFTVETI